MLRLPSFVIFRHRAYARFWFGRVLSVLGVQIQATAIGWQIYDAAREHGQSVAEAAFLLGAVGLAQFLPLLVLSLFGGQAADRYNRKIILMICLAAKAAIAVVLFLASALPPDSLIPIVFASAVGAGRDQCVSCLRPTARFCRCWCRVRTCRTRWRGDRSAFRARS